MEPSLYPYHPEEAEERRQLNNYHRENYGEEHELSLIHI